MCGVLVEFTRTKLGQTHPMSHSQAQLSAERAASFLSQSLRTVSRASHFLCNGDSRDEQVNLGVVIKEGVTSVAGHVIFAMSRDSRRLERHSFLFDSRVGAGFEQGLRTLLARSIHGRHTAQLIQHEIQSWTAFIGFRNCTAHLQQFPLRAQESICYH